MAVSSSYVSKRISERLTPSKALQDAKKRLGPVYFDAKLVECPQNAVILTKLLNHLDELDKQRLKIIEEGRKNQRILLHTLQSRYIRDIKLPPPGFRFHANGDPKLSLLQSSDRPTRFQNLCEQEDVLLTQTFIRSDCNLDTFEIKQKSSNATEEFVEFKDEIQEIENIIRELEDDLKKSKINVNNVGSAREKAMSFLRAHSQGEEALVRTASEPLKFSQPNDRFPFQPGSSTFACKKGSIAVEKIPKSTLHSTCIACQYKLKHSSEDFQRLTDDVNRLKPKRWNIGFHGTSMNSPSSNLSTPSSILHLKSKSQSLHVSNQVTFSLDNCIQSELRNQNLLRPKSSSAMKNFNKLDDDIRPAKNSYSYRGRSASALPDNRQTDAWKRIMVSTCTVVNCSNESGIIHKF